MNDHTEMVDQIFFANNGEIDLLTGAISQSRFDQIIKRDLQLSDRNQNQLLVISLRFNLKNYLVNINQMDMDQVKTEVESQLVKIYFDLQNIFRQSDCICRVSALGFWIFLTGINKSDGELLLTRTIDLLPKYLDLAVSYHNSGESQLDWYAQIDKLHFLK
jgi:GGDEF domain-containing protein